MKVKTPITMEAGRAMKTTIQSYDKYTPAVVAGASIRAIEQYEEQLDAYREVIKRILLAAPQDSEAEDIAHQAYYDKDYIERLKAIMNGDTKDDL